MTARIRVLLGLLVAAGLLVLAAFAPRQVVTSDGRAGTGAAAGGAATAGAPIPVGRMTLVAEAGAVGSEEGAVTGGAWPSTLTGAGTVAAAPSLGSRWLTDGSATSGPALAARRGQRVTADTSTHPPTPCSSRRPATSRQVSPRPPLPGCRCMLSPRLRVPHPARTPDSPVSARVSATTPGSCW